MRVQKRKIHIEMARDAPLFTLHESSITMPSTIVTKCMSTNYDIKDPLLFLAHHFHETAASRCSFCKSRPKRRGAHYSIKRDTLHLTLCQSTMPLLLLNERCMWFDSIRDDLNIIDDDVNVTQRRNPMAKKNTLSPHNEVKMDPNWSENGTDGSSVHKFGRKAVWMDSIRCILGSLWAPEDPPLRRWD